MHLEEDEITARLVNQGEQYSCGEIGTYGSGSGMSDWWLNVHQRLALFEPGGELRRKGTRWHGSDALDSE